MASVNRVILVGNLGQDPKITTFQNGGKVANLTIATSERWVDKSSGEEKKSTEWHRVAIYSKGLVEIVEKCLNKGSKVYLEGQLETRKWKDKNGQDAYTTEVVLRQFGSTLIMLGSRTVSKEPSWKASMPDAPHDAEEGYGDQTPF